MAISRTSSLDTVKDILDNKLFTFYEYDINDDEKMEELSKIAGFFEKPLLDEED